MKATSFPLRIPATRTNVFANWFNAQAENYESSRFGLMVVYILIQSCLGSMACMYILMSGANIFMLMACAMVTIVTNAVIIAQTSARWCVGTFFFSILLSLVFISLTAFS